MSQGTSSPPDGAPRDAADTLACWLGTQPGGVAMAWLDGSRVQFFQVGRHGTQDLRAIDPDSLFEIGSVTKVFTTVLLADSVQAGKVAWDDAIGPPYAPGRITYAQLATHTSGLPRLPTTMSIGDPDNPYAAQDLEALVRDFACAAPRASPAPPAYSNFGMAVLGQALAGAWGTGFEELLRSRVLTPLALNDTCVSWRDADRQRLTPGHGPDGIVTNWDLAAYAPTGCLVSSARDLARFAQACMGMASPLRDAMAATFAARAVADGNDVLAGWQSLPLGTTVVTFHDGGTAGYRSFLALDRSRRRGLVLLSNHDRDLDDLALRLWTGEWPPAPQTANLDAPTLAGYVGEYALGPARFTVTLRGEQVYVRLSGQPAYPVFPSARDEFSYRVVDAQLSFVRDARGRVSALVLHQGGIDQTATRVP